MLYVVDPVIQLYSAYAPPLSLRIERAAPKLESAERRQIIDTLEADRHELSNSISHIELAMAQLAGREKALTAQLSEVEQERARYADALARYEQRWKGDGPQDDGQHSSEGGGASGVDGAGGADEGADEEVNSSSAAAAATAATAESKKAAELRHALDVTLPELHCNVHRQLVTMREDYRRLADKLEGIQGGRSTLTENIDVVREAEEAAASEGLDRAEGAPAAGADDDDDDDDDDGGGC